MPNLTIVGPLNDGDGLNIIRQYPDLVNPKILVHISSVIKYLEGVRFNEGNWSRGVEGLT